MSRFSVHSRGGFRYTGSVRRPARLHDCPAPGEPCPWVGCRHHRYLDVNPRTGKIKLNFPSLEPDELDEPCTLRIGPVTLEQVALMLNVTRERVRQIETTGIRKLRRDWRLR